MPKKNFEKVLIANRGEIALRVHRACRDLGIKTVAVHSVIDRNSMCVRVADESVCIGPNPSIHSYLNIASIVAACEITGADAVHPGYGFLAENPKFVEILEEHDISFIGPSMHHMRIMGDKIQAKQMAKKLGLPLVPGSDGDINNLEEASIIAKNIGYPILIKATAGGGGRGMKIAHSARNLETCFYLAKAEAKAAFSNDSVYIEKYLTNPNHIEVQVLGDKMGNIIHLGERDCSLQRRHQKVLEESPSPLLSFYERSFITDLTVSAMRKLGYYSAGTVEYLYQNGQFYFIEMNTRIQVEHPVTEMVTGVDIVQEQIRIAAGFLLRYTQDAVTSKGHAIECRINAEDPYNNFSPSPGKITDFHVPGGPGVRIDSSAYRGCDIPPHYDSMIGKLIVHAENREACLRRLQRTLEECVITGIKTTVPLFQDILQQADIMNGSYGTYWLEDYLNFVKENKICSTNDIINKETINVSHNEKQEISREEKKTFKRKQNLGGRSSTNNIMENGDLPNQSNSLHEALTTKNKASKNKSRHNISHNSTNNKNHITQELVVDV